MLGLLVDYSCLGVLLGVPSYGVGLKENQKEHNYCGGTPFETYPFPNSATVASNTSLSPLAPRLRPLGTFLEPRDNSISLTMSSTPWMVGERNFTR